MIIFPDEHMACLISLLDNLQIFVNLPDIFSILLLLMDFFFQFLKSKIQRNKRISKLHMEIWLLGTNSSPIYEVYIFFCYTWFIVLVGNLSMTQACIDSFHVWSIYSTIVLNWSENKLIGTQLDQVGCHVYVCFFCWVVSFDSIFQWNLFSLCFSACLMSCNCLLSSEPQFYSSLSLLARFWMCLGLKHFDGWSLKSEVKNGRNC